MKRTVDNLQHDWGSILEDFSTCQEEHASKNIQDYGVDKSQAIHEIKKLIALEVDLYKNQSFLKKVLKELPEWNPFKHGVCPQCKGEGRIHFEK